MKFRRVLSEARCPHPARRIHPAPYNPNSDPWPASHFSASRHHGHTSPTRAQNSAE